MLRQSPILPFTLGLMAIYLAMRTLADNARLLTLLIGGALLLAGILLAVTRIRRFSCNSDVESRAAAGVACKAYCLCLFGLCIYAIAHNFFDGAEYASMRTTLNVTWPFVMLLGYFPAIGIEMALASMTGSPMLELWRVKLAAHSARIIVYSFIVFAGANYAASQWNRKIDLSYFRTTAVSKSTQSIANNLSEPIRLLLFAPPGNEVMQQTLDYLQTLATISTQLKLEVVDQARTPNLAREFKVQRNGVLVFAKDGRSETLSIGLEMESARRKLRNLDSEVAQRLLKITRPPRTIYFTTGHMELDYSANTSSDKRAGLSTLKSRLEELGFTCKRLGIAEGLGSEIPKDANLVLIAGPTEPFLPNERNAIKKYLQNGGRLLALIDPEHGVTEDELLAPLGVKVTKALVASQRMAVKIPDRGDSPYNFVTIRASSHPSVTTLSKETGRLVVVFLGAGAVVKNAPPKQNLQQVFTISSSSDSWLDYNTNGRVDGNFEKQASNDLAVAIEQTTKQSETENTPQMRAIVVGDADLATNSIIRNQGNKYFILDGIKWLTGDEELAGPTTSEEDIALVHKRDDDTVWFYGISFAAPAIVLSLGLFAVRTNKKRRQL